MSELKEIKDIKEAREIIASSENVVTYIPEDADKWSENFEKYLKATK